MRVYCDQMLNSNFNFSSEFREKFNDVDDDETDTVEYELKNTFFYRPDLSNGLTGDEIVTIPHPLLFVSRGKFP